VPGPALPENGSDIKIFESAGPDGQGCIADGVVEEEQAEGEFLEVNLVTDQNEFFIRQENLSG
jgi:hypothetical protein